ncbi:hypothetical protein WP50_22255 [Lactiplantibacillus plantarum]|nr:hypothetical protein WP50_22255 [Lactiplantibacillus plantarum]
MSKALKIVMGITMLTGGIMAQKMTVHAAESNTRTGQAVRMNIIILVMWMKVVEWLVITNTLNH